MTNYLDKGLPGAGYAEIAATLGLAPEATVGEVLQTIEHLKARKSRKMKKSESGFAGFEDLQDKKKP